MTTLARSMTDTGRVLRTVADGPWIDGEQVTRDVTGEDFRCLLRVDTTAETPEGGQSFTGRLTVLPGVSLKAEDRVSIDAADIGTAVWQIVGPPIEVRRGRRAMAQEARLRRKEGI